MCLATDYTRYLLLGLVLLAPSLCTGGGVVQTFLSPTQAVAESGTGLNSNPVVVGVTLGLSAATSVALSVTGIKSEAEKVERFVERFRTSKRALRKDLLRLSGSEYVWVRDQILKVPKENQSRFRCEVHRERDDFKSLVNRANSAKRETVSKLYNWLTQMRDRASRTSVYRDPCALYATYIERKEALRNVLVNSVGGDLSDWVRRRYLGVVNKRLFQCELKLRRNALRTTFDEVGKAPLARIGSLHEALIRLTKTKDKSCLVIPNRTGTR